jgi:predicted DNA-binding transcriptional regulator YafY
VNRIDRLVAILIHLQGRRVTRAEELAEEFGISIRTVYRDIAALGEAGVPVIGEAGIGYSIIKGYHLPPVHFTTEEATALLTANLLVGRFADQSLLPAMDSALAKIRAVLPPDQQDHVTRLENRMSLPRYPNAPKPTTNLYLIQRALAERRVLRMDYCKSGAAESERRDVEPLGLIYYDDRWHLIAWCRVRKDYRDFRTDRIGNIFALPERFEGHDDFSVKNFLEAWDEPHDRVQGIIQTDAKAAERFRKEAPFTILGEKRDKDLVTFTIESPVWPLGWLLSFGPRLTVLEPNDLRESILEMARITMKHYEQR